MNKKLFFIIFSLLTIPYKTLLSSEWQFWTSATMKGNLAKNVKLEFSNQARFSQSLPTMTYFVVRSDSVATKELGPWEFKLNTLSFDAMTMTFSVDYNIHTGINASRVKYSTTKFPGIAPK